MKQLIEDLKKSLEQVEYHDDHANIDRVVLYLRDMEATAKLIAAKANKMITEIDVERY